jgi:hypothetical protein
LIVISGQGALREGSDVESAAPEPLADEPAPRKGIGSSMGGKEPVLTDEEISRKGRLVDLENKETAVAKLKDALETEKENRRLRHWVANGALVVMLAQVVAANATFIWYGDVNGWDISPTAISAWMGATVIQVVSVVLVIIKYLFPPPGNDGEA